MFRHFRLHEQMYFQHKAHTHCLSDSLLSLSPGEGGPPDTTFIEDAVLELLKTRRILKCSYPYGFFLEPKSTKKEIYELMQVSVLLIGKKLMFTAARLIWNVRDVELKLSTS